MPENTTVEETVEGDSTDLPSGSHKTAPSSSDGTTLNRDNCITGSSDLEDEDEVIQNHGLSDAGMTCLPSLWQQEVVFAKKIDKTCRALFPAMFIFFNLIYWLHYQVLT